MNPDHIRIGRPTKTDVSWEAILSQETTGTIAEKEIPGRGFPRYTVYRHGTRAFPSNGPVQIQYCYDYILGEKVPGVGPFFGVGGKGQDAKAG